MAALQQGLPDYRIDVLTLSRWRGDRRVATACLAQVSLRDVLLASTPRLCVQGSNGCRRLPG
jgi:hypothetical protein